MQHTVHNLYSQKAAMQRIVALKVCFAVTTGDLSLNKWRCRGHNLWIILQRNTCI